MNKFTPFLLGGITALFASPLFAVTSSFDEGTQGWGALGDIAAPVTWTASGGNPGGYISITDAATGGTTYFVAPTQFLGNQINALGHTLSFDLQQRYSGSANQFAAADVILRGAGLTLVFDLPSNPAKSAWTSYSVPLVASAWHIDSTAGNFASPAQFSAVLNNLTALHIRAEYRSGADVGLLDNVTLVPEPSTYSLLIMGGLFLSFFRKRLHT